jgi:uncharacterized membrane protein YkoI
MRRQTKAIVAAGAALALATGGVGVAVATGGDDSERPIGGTALDRVRAAALEHVGGGRVSETEVGDEESLYEVEVTRPDGTQIDVQLDRGFHVVGTEADSENESEPREDRGSL